jgi:hypothetical protein
MPTLRRWFGREYARLEAEGKSALAVGFEAANRAYFEGDYAVALGAIPEVRRLAEALGEPAWQVVADYYAATAAIGWQGDLSRGVALATQAVVRARRIGSHMATLDWYAREALLGAWLEVDGPGYVADVSDALDELPQAGMPPDVRTRFAIIRARCLAVRGDGEAALRLALEGLHTLEWPEPFEHSLRATALGWAGRHDEAVSSYRAAMDGYRGPGMAIERVGAQLGMVEALLALGRVDEALHLLDAVVEPARGSINRAQAGTAEGLTGQALLAQGSPADAANWLAAALGTLDGLGWLRSEAEFALRRVEALSVAGTGRSSEAWRAAVDDAATRIGRLRRESGGTLGARLAQLEAGRAA